MQAAPQVLYPLGRPRRLHAWLACWLVGSLALMAAVAASQPSLDLVVIMGGLLLPAACGSVRAAAAPGHSLRWDGECWHLQGTPPVRGQLELALDLQHALLLRWASPYGTTNPACAWLWIEQHADPVAWKDVRRAIYWHTR